MIEKKGGIFKIMDETAIQEIQVTPVSEWKDKMLLMITSETTKHVIGNASIVVLKEENLSLILSQLFQIISKEIVGQNPFCQRKMDQALIHLESRLERTKLSSKVLFGISKSICQVAANSLEVPLFFYLGGISGSHIPYPVVNLGNQEILLMKDIFPTIARLNVKKEIEEKLEKIRKNISIEEKKQLVLSVIQKMEIEESLFEWVSLAEKENSQSTKVVAANNSSTVTNLIEKIRNAKMSGKLVILEDTTEKEDTFIADLSVGLNLQYINFGEVQSQNHHAQYNRLMAIEEQIV